jgi:hypothetical protein
MFLLKKAALLIALVPAAALAQVQIEVTGPSIHWPAPPHLVVVTEGVQVVENYDQEVFYVDGYYWSRTGDRWYRSHDHRGHWVVVESPPSRLARVEPGRYRHYRAQHVAPPPPRAVAPHVIVPAPKLVRPHHDGVVRLKTHGNGRGHGKH